MDTLSASSRWTHMSITAAGFALTLEHIGSEYGRVFAAVGTVCLICASVLYASHMWSEYREED